MQSEAITKEHIIKDYHLTIAMDKKAAIALAISEAWKKIAPWWPLKNLIATNPLQGFEDLPFEQATSEAGKYFQPNIPDIEMANINLETIKWCQIFFDEGQAVITMPGRKQGLYQAWRQLILVDKRLHGNKSEHIHFLKNLPLQAEEAIDVCLKNLQIHEGDASHFLTLLLTTLPGWAGYIKYQNEWTQGYLKHAYTINQAEYLSMRLILTCVLWPNAAALLQQPLQTTLRPKHEIVKNERIYQHQLIQSLQPARKKINNRMQAPDAQLVFCIDVRSEAIRRAVEAEGNYETYGFAGFFGIPVIIRDPKTEECYASCPVLLEPQHIINKISCCDLDDKDNHFNFNHFAKQGKRLYQSMKYMLTTPFILAEAIGPWSGIWMTLRTLLPVTIKNTLAKLAGKNKQQKSFTVELNVDTQHHGISISDQCMYAENCLRMIGITNDFAKLVIFCGHVSTTENNAYATALDCGACGGHDGAGNATILASILNNPLVRDRLKEKGITIPNDTYFAAGLHNTTTDEISILDAELNIENEHYRQLKDALERAKYKNNLARHKNLSNLTSGNEVNDITRRSADWSQTRPEWGLARNAAFIIAPRTATRDVKLDGRSFLHSYDWRNDSDGSILTTILTAPMVVAQWINCQYLFSTLDNVSFGSGSKITHNVVGKMGIMQGNASDLMSGLPLQSIMRNDHQAYHEPLRLLTIIYAPKTCVSEIIEQQPVLQKLFGNGWVLAVSIDPTDDMTYELQSDFSWKKSNVTDAAMIRMI